MLLEFDRVTGKSRTFYLDQISFALPAGYIMGLAGKNGAGKTTLLDYIMNPKRRYGGAIRLSGEDIKTAHAAMRGKIGFVSEENRFFEEFSAKQNADMLGTLYTDFSAELFCEEMKRAGVSVSKTVGTMSRGERMRFQMAFAIAHNPVLYLLDEASAGMDPVFKRDFFGMLHRVIEGERASVLMTTNMEWEAERNMDFIGVLEEGRLVSFEECVH